MKFYIATGLENVATYQKVKTLLALRGHSITYDWSGHGSAQAESIDRQQEVCDAEVDGVREAQAVIVILPGGRGTHTELGLAIAWEKPVLIYDPNDHLNGPDGKRICIFYRALNVAIVYNWAGLIAEIEDLAGTT